jgi:hypothetical protein
MKTIKVNFFFFTFLLLSSIANAHPNYDPANPPTSEVICEDAFTPLRSLGVLATPDNYTDCYQALKGHAKQIASVWVCQDLVRLYAFGRLPSPNDMIDCFRVIADRVYSPEQVERCNGIPARDFKNGHVASPSEIISCMQESE